jgi:hypothetical protein
MNRWRVGVIGEVRKWMDVPLQWIKDPLLCKGPWGHQNHYHRVMMSYFV